MHSDNVPMGEVDCTVMYWNWIAKVLVTAKTSVKTKKTAASAHKCVTT